MKASSVPRVTWKMQWIKSHLTVLPKMGQKRLCLRKQLNKIGKSDKGEGAGQQAVTNSDVTNTITSGIAKIRIKRIHAGAKNRAIHPPFFCSSNSISLSKDREDRAAARATRSFVRRLRSRASGVSSTPSLAERSGHGVCRSKICEDLAELLRCVGAIGQVGQLGTEEIL